jgi:hypothetical protein
MFCGSTLGEMLPPMIVFKAQNIYTSWCERRPKGALYSSSKSSWFDGCQFKKRFFEILLPRLKRRTSKKLILCDNLASHLSPAVNQACWEHNTTTDKLQPVDFGIFAPLKSAWRSVL